MQPAVRIHIVVSGDVQGVFFRAGTRSAASGLGLTGWVRNRPDGSVEVMAEGGRGALEKLLEWCGRGPAGASVSKVEHEWLAAGGEFSGFRVKYD